jgi:hypothetical protein
VPERYDRYDTAKCCVHDAYITPTPAHSYMAVAL